MLIRSVPSPVSPAPHSLVGKVLQTWDSSSDRLSSHHLSGSNTLSLSWLTPFLRLLCNQPHLCLILGLDPQKLTASRGMTYELQVCLCKFRLCALIKANHEKAFRTLSRSIWALMVGGAHLQTSERLVQSFSYFLLFWYSFVSVPCFTLIWIKTSSIALPASLTCI